MEQAAVNLDNPSVQRILRAAGACFGRKGYRGASMQDIAREAGVSKSLLHYHFTSKEHLLLEVQLLMIRDLLDRIRLVAAEETRTIEHFSRALEQVLGFLESDLDSILVLFELRSVLPENPALAERLARFNEEVIALIVEGIENVLGPYVDRLRIPPERLARMLRTLLQGLLIDLAFARDEAAQRAVHETFADFRAMLTDAIVTRLS